jgi:hypothetical protein
VLCVRTGVSEIEDSFDGSSVMETAVKRAKRRHACGRYPSKEGAAKIALNASGEVQRGHF